MSYYFPYKYTNTSTTSIPTSSYAVSATTASFSASVSVLAQSAFYAAVVDIKGPSGSRGPDATGCVGTLSGSAGPPGASGSRGQANYDCPSGYYACPELTPPSNLYSIVCLPYPTPCTGTTIVCPSSYTP